MQVHADMLISGFGINYAGRISARYCILNGSHIIMLSN